MTKFIIGGISFLLVLFSLFLVGAGLVDIFSGANTFQSLVLLSLGIIMASVFGLTLFVAKVTSESTKINMELIRMMVDMQMNQSRSGAQGGNPFSMLQNLMKGFPGTETNLQILGTDENGNLKSMEHHLKPGEDINEVLAKMLGVSFSKEKPAKKTIEEMGVKELKAELQKALDKEEFKKAALLRDKIKELEDKGL